jgi:asparagine synthase (glutamine-hydrolysing)
MCGLSFYLSNKRSYIPELKKSLFNTAHRGPDFSNFIDNNTNNYFIGLGHNRLKIIDLSPEANQPMSHKSGVTLIFNGEIYNFLELRKNLIEKGHTFISNSDTEVILNMYLEFGQKCFGYFKGMFAIIIYDPKIDKVFMGRDVLGIKPLYISFSENEIFASSEIRGVKPFLSNLSVDHNDVYEFFNNGFLYEPSTGFKEVKKLLPGTCLSINLNSFETELTEYKKLYNYNNNLSLLDKFKNAVSAQSVSDVPLGIFFSGGHDSSMLACLSSDQDLFYAEYSKNNDGDIDKKYSKLISKHLKKDLKTCHLDEPLDKNELIEQIKFVAKNSEELICDYTFWPTYKLSNSAKKNGFTVMLSGMGGDEVFAGYPRYKLLRFNKAVLCFGFVFKIMKRFKIYPKSLDKKISRLISYCEETNWAISYSRLLGYFSRNELGKLFKDDEKHLFNNLSNKLDIIMDNFKGNIKDKVKLAQHFDRSGFLSHNLMVADKASMLASIEIRVPILDEAVAAEGIATPSKGLVDLNQTKKPIIKILRTLLPSNLLDRKKTGFNPPIEELIKNIGKEGLYKEFESLNQYIDKGYAFTILDKHFSNKENNSYKIWQILFFKYWLSFYQEKR